MKEETPVKKSTKQKSKKTKPNPNPEPELIAIDLSQAKPSEEFFQLLAKGQVDSPRMDYNL